MLRLFIFFTFLVVASVNCLAKSVVIVGPQSEEDTSHSYFVELLNLAINKTKDTHPYQNITILNSGQPTQGRSIQLLKNNVTNIYWTGTSLDREASMLPIRVPLFKGLLGYRVSIIRKENLEDFINIDEATLKSKVACQGQHWPDSDILEANGYRVLRVARFDLMFKMLQQKRCDYFPRAIFEGYGELAKAQLKYPELMIYDQTILHYPFAYYFFTNSENEVLASQIEAGLVSAINDGSLLALMQNHPATKGVFPLEQWRLRRYFHLNNALLPDVSTHIDSDLWLTLYQVN
ncbi:hypothetical protein LP316_05385 [Thalassotalea sp. LPB0316]|uniref:hypothetical protein n=1 Tax=Thalassotalea sp. LPB0316 TaxID=2769490 RepID=UPI001867E186|nr:hypothetical protein [Thalassotalea sp. LPB0316]QOL26733.1 hypothetical protein LP316_05385 [Thalassotalea sp. LPB0316]